mmetsp:Transcript_15343/g.33373  ORF Transcript_15343/g.33373 Transcript_15343/m.33373 type:complete len:310 (+) Transcript_15343:94-1023(+)
MLFFATASANRKQQRSAVAVAALFILGFTSKTLPASADVQEGQICGIYGADFLDESFLGEAAVAGPACALNSDGYIVPASSAGGNPGGNYCFCSHARDDESLGEWVWLCNRPGAGGEVVPFGPAPGKTCPDVMPDMPGGADSDNRPDCDLSLHPTGVDETDPACPYNTCDGSGGGTTAVCGCVDMNAYGFGVDATKWFCLHSTCECGDRIDNILDEDETRKTDPLLKRCRRLRKKCTRCLRCVPRGTRRGRRKRLTRRNRRFCRKAYPGKTTKEVGELCTAQCSSRDAFVEKVAPLCDDDGGTAASPGK